jgi:hypothetical protein
LRGQGFGVEVQRPPEKIQHPRLTDEMCSSWSRFRAKMEQLTRFEGIGADSQGQILVLTVSYVPYSLDSGLPPRLSRPCGYEPVWCSQQSKGSRVSSSTPIPHTRPRQPLLSARLTARKCFFAPHLRRILRERGMRPTPADGGFGRQKPPLP